MINNNYDINIDENLLISFDNNIDYEICKYNNLIINIHSDFKNIIKNYLYILKRSSILEGTKIKTDQGEINVESLNIYKHTIHNSKIIALTREINYNSKKFLLFKKNCLKENIPNNDIFIDPDEKIIFENKIIDAKIFLIKYSNNVEVVDCRDISLFNILFDNDIYLNLNNLNIKSFNYFYDNYNLIEKNIYYKKNWKILSNYELLNHYNDFGRYENKVMHYKLNINNADFNQFKLDYNKYKNYTNKQILNNYMKKGKINNEILINEYADLDKYKENYKDLKNYSKKELWYHWINYGKKEKRTIYYKLIYDNSDFNKYRKDYYDVKDLSDKEAWDHWNKYGLFENRKLYNKYTLTNADIKKYQNDYKHLYN